MFAKATHAPVDDRRRTSPSPNVRPNQAPVAERPTHRTWQQLAMAAQTKLQGGSPEDPAERQADRVAEQVTTTAERGGGHACPTCSGGEPPCPACRQDGLIQRKAQGTPSAATNEGQLLDRIGDGAPLTSGVRDRMEPLLGRDLGQVRVHTGAKADRSARDLGASAFTLWNHIAFREGRYAPDTTDGRRLLAHELTHVAQQGHAATHESTGGAIGSGRGPLVGSTGVQRKDEKAKDGEAAGPWRSGTICDRASRENTDFPRTHIDRVSIDLGNMASGMTLHWVNPTGLSLPTGGFAISPGAGVCCLDCNDETTSQTAHTDCTPKGSWHAHRKACVLSDTSWAKNPTYFSRAGIAIHAGDGHLPGYPNSHGCVRTTGEASAIVHDNSVYSAAYGADPDRGLPDRRTEVVVSGTWNGPRCYPTEHARSSVSRASRCASSDASGTDGPSSGAGATEHAEQTAPQPVVATLESSEEEQGA